MTRLMRLARLCFVVFCMGPVLSGQTHTLGTYAYDSSGNVKSIGPDASGLTNFYDYDSAGRLLQFVRKESNGTVVIKETFEYDAFGNLTRLTTNGVVTSLDADTETNRLVAATYDGAGNMLQNGPETYDLDPVGTLTQKSGSWGDAFYIYTADDERIGIEGPDGTWRYMARDVDGKVLREWASSSWDGAWTWSEDYVYRDGQLAAAVRPAAQGGNRHFHLDHLGSPRLISNQDRAIYAEHAYYPYGREITSPTQELAAGHDTPEPMKFTGHERDFAGTYTAPVLDYMHARYYNPQAGRFLSVDPGKDWDIYQPQSWNLYSYVRNNPLRFVDPTGRAAAESGDEKDKPKPEPKPNPQPKPAPQPQPQPTPGEKLTFLPDNDPHRTAAKWNRVPDNTILINSHGGPNTVCHLNAKQLANKIKAESKTWKPGTTIILNSCNSARGNNSIAQQLSSALHTTVIGHDQPVWSFGPFDLGSWGTHGADGGMKTGGGVDFTTRGNRLTFVDGVRQEDDE
jgi:RHS repeat-associated protein